ncbi:hypothetical protein [Paenibacillus faecalis]|nr:hypothetical protein [Paenibacillus faecalis]
MTTSEIVDVNVNLSCKAKFDKVHKINNSDTGTLSFYAYIQFVTYL